MSALLELAERCEAAKEADTSWLMKDVGAVVYGHGSDAQKCRRFYRLIREGAYLDAAMTLAPEGWRWQVESLGVAAVSKGGMQATSPDPLHSKAATTPALALVAAALRARAILEGEG